VRGRQPAQRDSPVGCCEGHPGSALNSNLHFHALVTHGVFTCPAPFTRALFHPAGPQGTGAVSLLALPSGPWRIRG